jgi:hypothetical protein
LIELSYSDFGIDRSRPIEMIFDYFIKDSLKKMA